MSSNFKESKGNPPRINPALGRPPKACPRCKKLIPIMEGKFAYHSGIEVKTCQGSNLPA